MLSPQCLTQQLYFREHRRTLSEHVVCPATEGVHHSSSPSTSPSTYPQPSQNTLPGSLGFTYRRLLRQRGQGSSQKMIASGCSVWPIGVRCGPLLFPSRCATTRNLAA